MRVVTFYNSVAGVTTLSWTADADVLIQGAQAFGSADALISLDPSLLYSTFTAPAARVVQDKFVTACSANSCLNRMQIPVAAGEVVYCAFKATIGIVQLYVDNVS